MLKKMLLGLAIVVLLFVVVVALQPSTYRVERSATMAAPPAAVFAQINDFHNWEAWSPWAKLDPHARNAFEGPSSGKGAVFRWDGNSDVGQGSLTIVESKPNEYLRIRLDFVKPFEDTANVEFTLRPDGEQTRVTWSIDGHNNFIGKAICLFLSMDRMIGDRYEEGLANIKKIVEAPPKP